MNPAQLVAYFDRISDAPDAVPRLRRFILDLAVRGKLVEQDFNDEPASELLKRIRAERTRLVKEGEIPKEKNVAPLNAAVPYPIPYIWQWVTLGSLVRSMTNGIYKPSSFYADDGVLCLRMYNIKDGRINFDNVKRITLTSGELEAYRLSKGDLLVNRVNSRELVGKAAPIPHCNEDLIFESKNIRVRLMETEVLPHYSNLLFQTALYRTIIEGYAKQACGQATVSQPQLAELPVALPPLAEQHRIVTKVDELMALCDRLEAAQTERERWRDRLVAASLHRVNNGADADASREHARFHLQHLSRLTTHPEHIQQLRQTILNIAVRGRLVAQDPNDEPASELVKGIQVEKVRLMKEGRIRKQQPLPSLDAGEIPFEVPEHWQWLRIGNVGFTQTGTTPSSNNPEYFGDYIPFVKPADLTGNTVDYTGDGISEAGVEHSRLIPKHSVLMVCIGSSIGKVNITDRDVCCNQQINTVTPYIEHLTTFTSFAMKAIYFQKLVRANAGMGTLPIISKGKWEMLPVPLPPLAEQHRIVAKVDELMALCDRLEAQLTAAQTESRRLLEAVLHEALASSA